MQSDAFPTPPVYGYLFQPRLLQPFTGFDGEPAPISKFASNFASNFGESNESDRHLEKLHSHLGIHPDRATAVHTNSQALNGLLSDIETLIVDCSSDESQLFWSATDCVKLKHQIITSMQKIEALFLDLAKTATQDPNLISALAEGLLYAGAFHRHQSD